MKKIAWFFAALILFTAQFSIADDASQKEAGKLLDEIGMEKMLEQSIQQMLQVQIQQNPGLAPYKNVMLKFFAKNMSYESLKPEFVKIYAEAFSAKELREINQFYKTPTGKKSVELMPQLMAQGAQIGAARVQSNIGELQQMIADESKRIEAEKTPAAPQAEEK